MLRLAALLPSAQQRAAIAVLPDEKTLEARFALHRPAGSPLAGVPYFLKDSLRRRRRTHPGRFLVHCRKCGPNPAVDSAIVRAFAPGGAVLGGKAHLHEVCPTGSPARTRFSATWSIRVFPGRTSGGSSSGSVAPRRGGRRAAGDRLGHRRSVRVPAAFCGLHGFRLTPHDRVDPRCLFPLSRRASIPPGGSRRMTADMRLAIIARSSACTAAGANPRGSYLEPAGLDPDVAVACRAAAVPRSYAPADPARP